jgi:hypothetical protein
MKIRLWHIGVFVVALLVSVVAWAPAAFFIPQRPDELTYRRAEGTIWDARLVDLHVGGYTAREATWRLNFADVIRGRAIVPVTLSGGEMDGSLTLLGNVGGDRRLAIQSLRLAGAQLGGLRLAGETRIEGFDVLFQDGVCARALGRIDSDVLAVGGAELGWAGPPLTGDVACDGEDARVVLSGANDQGERVDLRILLGRDGAASWRLSVLSEQPETVQLLAAQGFTADFADGSLGYGGEARWFP